MGRIQCSRSPEFADGIGGGVVDHIQGVKGFVANSSPLPTKAQPDVKPNYRNLKAQCSYLLADKVNTHGIAIKAEVISEVPEITPDVFKQLVIEDLEQIKRRNPDKDGPVEIVPKEEVKEKLGRSPDFGDPLVMRMIFELKKAIGNIPTTVQGGAKPYYPQLGV